VVGSQGAVEAKLWRARKRADEGGLQYGCVARPANLARGRRRVTRLLRRSGLGPSPVATPLPTAFKWGAHASWDNAPGVAFRALFSEEHVALGAAF
jgi:hypothetical protein